MSALWRENRGEANLSSGVTQLWISADQVFSISLTTGSGIGIVEALRHFIALGAGPFEEFKGRGGRRLVGRCIRIIIAEAISVYFDQVGGVYFQFAEDSVTSLSWRAIRWRR